ncbi:hypothetical protein MBCUT_18190 [Methanobrevibacter cuticularis]|uniref:Probable membrane transporter protein n=1 Tax=Methanobrevibacter cuticularis TaxID=47311 RepID=A0A166CKD5_9EURY|nr:sulfite exporter TauE/SafE family protein [Methanobrevibacter cuticularis]KZX15017.1 hypothetical protein MBCUT_18190 [Methanobrevibacter cuticularis]
MIFSIEYIILLMFIGVFAGISSGLLGVGGGFLMVPLQFFLLTSTGIDTDLALRISLGTSLAIIIPTSLAGAYTHQNRLKKIIKPGIILGIFGMLGGVLGGITSSLLPAAILQSILGIFLALISIYMVANKDSEKQSSKLKFSMVIGAILGVSIGFSSGLLGIGGGILLVPALIFFLGFSIKESIGISSIFIFLTAIGGTASYILTGLKINTLPYYLGYISLINFGIIAIFSIPMAYLGAKLVYRSPEKLLKLIFAILMFFIGIKLLGLDPIGYIGHLIVNS